MACMTGSSPWTCCGFCAEHAGAGRRCSSATRTAATCPTPIFNCSGPTRSWTPNWRTPRSPLRVFSGSSRALAAVGGAVLEQERGAQHLGAHATAEPEPGLVAELEVLAAEDPRAARLGRRGREARVGAGHAAR